MVCIYNALHKAIRFILFAILSFMVIVVTMQIVCRYVFFYSLSWSEELSRYLFVWLILMGAGFGIAENNAICIDIIETIAKGKFKRAIHLIQYVLSLVAVCVLFYSSILLMQLGTRQISPAMNVPMSMVYLCMPIGFILMIFELIIKIILFFIKKDKLLNGGEA